MADINKLTETVARYELRVDEYAKAVEKFLAEYKHQCKFCFRDKVEGADFCADHSPYLKPTQEINLLKWGKYEYEQTI